MILEELLKFLLFLFSGFAVFLITQLLIILIKIYAKPTKKCSLKTKLLKKLRRRARKVCYVRASIRNKRLYYTIEVMIDCPRIYSKNFGVLLFGTYKKEEAIEELNYIRRQWILSNVCENKDGILALKLAEMNKELAKL